MPSRQSGFHLEMPQISFLHMNTGYEKFGHISRRYRAAMAISACFTCALERASAAEGRRQQHAWLCSELSRHQRATASVSGGRRQRTRRAMLRYLFHVVVTSITQRLGAAAGESMHFRRRAARASTHEPRPHHRALALGE